MIHKLSTYNKDEKAICEVAEDHDIWLIDDITLQRLRA